MTRRAWWLVIGVSQLALVVALVHGLMVDRSILAPLYVPGPTTHGHYQIELACAACHTPGVGVQQDSCLKCHAAELKVANDTHPPSKFLDPGKAHLLERIDASRCTTCHQEHVPERTHPMGLSMPLDYCIRCHDDIATQRPSHEGMTFQSCATAGCHNYHDNTALNENFLARHAAQPPVLDQPRVPVPKWLQELVDLKQEPNTTAETASTATQTTTGESTTTTSPAPLARPARPVSPKALRAEQHDAPREVVFSAGLMRDWSETAHAAAGVNCSGCHLTKGVADPAAKRWSNQVDHEGCRSCHTQEVEGFLAGRHGMRLSVGLSPMTPGDALLPMKHAAFHRELTCSSCHEPHRYDVRTAAVDACLKCHDDPHSRAYTKSKHYELWQAELAGTAAGSGVSCATCHMPRTIDDRGVFRVTHNQNDNMRPNEKMIRTSCSDCHGLQFSLDALADRPLIDRNFAGSSTTTIDSIEMAVQWFASQEAKRKRRGKPADKGKPADEDKPTAEDQSAPSNRPSAEGTSDAKTEASAEAEASAETEPAAERGSASPPAAGAPAAPTSEITPPVPP